MDWVMYLGLGLALVLLWRLLQRQDERNRNRLGLGAARRPKGDPGKLLRLASRLYGFFEVGGKPSDLVDNEDFQQGVEYLELHHYSVDDLLGYYSGENVVLACMALEALSRRGDDRDLTGPVLDSINSLAPATRYFALRCLGRRTASDRPLVGPVLARVDSLWLEPPFFEILRKFAATRLAAGEPPTFGESLRSIGDEQARFLLTLLPRLGVPGAYAEEVQQWQSKRIDRAVLGGIGRVWEPGAGAAAGPVEHRRLLAHVLAIQEDLQRSPRRSTLLVGESGVGKTAVVRSLARRLQKEGWTVFEAGHAELLAGMVYHGAFEKRLQTVVGNVGSGRKVLWIIPDFHALSMTGRHQYSASSALDFLLPHIESGDIAVLGETTPSAYDKQIRPRSRCRSALEIRRVEPLPEGETLELARKWAEASRIDPDTELIDGATLKEAWSLARQYQWSKATPGNLLEFLSLTRRRLMAGSAGPGRIGAEDLIVTLGQLTGLPDSLLDDRRRFDLEGLRALFQKRVMGQDEAIEVLVERVAMMKAGVTDPTRPQGVFLFAGPTGTGKTEIAKTLAEFLFGSPERMIRLDMTEFQEPASLDRLLGDAQEPRGDALVELIRKEPFSVILLDEFEKAHSNVWDIFLQVFDDGRLTDRWGGTADFRHAIIIMTSNLGGFLSGGASLGFTEGSETFSGRKVHQAIQKAFRKEFLNRIDRIVVFRPLGRDVMRAILSRELDAVFQRRGLRNRSWAVEWDDSAIEFLLRKGFTADLGARPLKRAIERHLLAPLATTIVNHQFPEGDQFLFVRGGGQELAVEFIDPDAPEPEPGTAEAAEEEAPGGLSVTSILLRPQGRREEIELLGREFQRLRALVQEDGLSRQKAEALAQTSRPGFWRSPERFKVLGTAEYVDRIEAGLRTAGSLVERLQGLGKRPGGAIPRPLLGRLAQHLYLIGRACQEPEDSSEAFVLLEAGRGTGVPGRSSSEFARRLGGMYRRWAEKRGMALVIVEEAGKAGTPYRLLFAVSGYAARPILAPEQGLHILEVPRSDGQVSKRAARVRVAPGPAQPQGSEGGDLRRQARRAFESSGQETLRIVRRYREEPSPLVRDHVRGWRTGHIQRVLDGDFDIIPAGKHGAPRNPS